MALEGPRSPSSEEGPMPSLPSVVPCCVGSHARQTHGSGSVPGQVVAVLGRWGGAHMRSEARLAVFPGFGPTGRQAHFPPQTLTRVKCKHSLNDSQQHRFKKMNKSLSRGSEF